MKTSKFVGLASALTMLASLAAIPASATCTNAYSVSYETLTEAVETDTGVTIPAGAVAVTMSIEGNTGFNANTLTLNIDDGYTPVTDKNGNPVIQKESVLSDAYTASSISQDNDTLCVAVASPTMCTTSGDLFTVYFNPKEEMERFVSFQSADASIATGEITAMSKNLTALGKNSTDYYYIGDTNSNKIVNAQDAANIMVAVSSYGNSINTLFLPDPDSVVRTYLPYVKYYLAPDANLNYVIDNVDAADILEYAALIGAGNTYSGDIGRRIPFTL